MDVKRRAALRALLLDAAPFISGARFDVALWAARAAYLLQPAPTDDVTSVTFGRRLAEQRDQIAGSAARFAALGTIRDAGKVAGPLAVGVITDVASLSVSATVMGATSLAAAAVIAFGIGETLEKSTARVSVR